MTKKLIGLLVISLFIIACGSNQNQTQEEAVEIPVLLVDDFDAEAENYVGEEVTIEGTVAHVCKHGGKRMFVFDKDDDVRIKVTVNDNMPSFDVELEGSDVIVTGIVDQLKIDEDYLVEWEAELADAANEEAEEDHGEEIEGEGKGHGEGEGLGDGHGEGEGEGEGSHSGQGEKADQGEHVDAYEMIAEYRAQIAESDKDYIAFYSIICNEFKEKKSE